MHLVRSCERGEAAVGPGDHALAADDAREAGEPLRHQFGMLDQHRRLGDHAGDEHLVVGQLDARPIFPLVLVARIGSLERVGARAHLEDDVDDVLELHVVDARAHIDAVAGVEADPVFRDALERRIERLDAQLCPFTAGGDVEVRARDVVGEEERIVDLQQEAGVDDRLVFLTHRLGDREHIGLG